MSESALVSIITVNFNQKAVTFELLESIRRQEYAPVETIVVDNGSFDNPEADLRLRYPEARFIRSEKNLGFAGGNNLALSEARGNYIFFVNNDAEIAPGCIPTLLNFFETHPAAGIASPLICFASPPDIIQYAGMTRVNPFTGRNQMTGRGQKNEGQYNLPVPTAYAHGAAMMVPKAVVEKIGPMFDDFFLYYEELDWCERIRKAGYEVWLEPRALVYHKESLTVGAMGPLKTYYINRNRIWFMRRHFRGLSLVVFGVFLIFFTIPKFTIPAIIRGDWAGLKAFFRGIWWNLR